MNRDLARQVRERAAESCEYCRIPQSALPLPFQIDHFIAEKHQGRYKGPNIAGMDEHTGQLARLFHPRIDRWNDHFEFDGGSIAGETPVGRATVQVLSMNAEGPVQLRRLLKLE